MTGWPPGSPNLPPPLTGGPHLVGSLSSLGQRCRGIPMEKTGAAPTVQAPLKIVAVSSQCRGRDHSRQGVLSVQHRHGVQMPIKLNPGDDRADPGMQPRCVASRGGGETCRYRTGGSGHHHEGRVDQGWQRRPLLLLQVKKTILILWLQRGLMAVAAVEGLPEDQSWSQPGRALKPIVQAIVQVPALQGFSRAPQTLGLGRRGVVDSGLQPQLGLNWHAQLSLPHCASALLAQVARSLQSCLAKIQVAEWTQKSVLPRPECWPNLGHGTATLPSGGGCQACSALMGPGLCPCKAPGSQPPPVRHGTALAPDARGNPYGASAGAWLGSLLPTGSTTTARGLATPTSSQVPRHPSCITNPCLFFCVAPFKTHERITNFSLC